MGNFRQHVGFASTLGVAYAWSANALAGVHWLYGSTAALLATIGGVLPDIDHPMGVEIKTLTTLLGTIGALVVWRRLRINGDELPIEAQLWLVVLVYFILRIGSRSVLTKVMVHRGMSHSLPTCLVWGALTYLCYPSHYHPVRVWMAGAVMLGFFSHLTLDEICSVDLRGHRVKRSFGSAIKFWAPSLFSTVAVYLLLYFLVRGVLNVWPNGPFLATLSEPVPAPTLPALPDDWRLPSGLPLPGTGRGADAGGNILPASIPRPAGAPPPSEPTRAPNRRVQTRRGDVSSGDTSDNPHDAARGRRNSTRGRPLFEPSS